MTDFIKLQTPDQSIQIGFTDQKVSGRAGLLSFAGFLHWHRLGALLARVLPQQRTSKKAIPVADLALGFLAAILDGAQKLVQVAHLRRDVLLPALLAIRCVGSQSSFTRFFQGFTSAGKNLGTFRPLWRWVMERLPSRKGGYSLAAQARPTFKFKSFSWFSAIFSGAKRESTIAPLGRWWFGPPSPRPRPPCEQLL